jgi:DHA1 family multidrug resistance protein-like MFS transporter
VKGAQTARTDGGHPGWKRNLVILWITQFLSITAFAMVMPFAPYYMQDLGVTDPDRLKIYVALFGAATPLALAISSPVWGVLADRFGRRLMLFRAHAAAGLVLLAMGLVHSVPALIVLRVLQGLFTGTMTAAITMVATNTPNERSGLAIGTLSASVYCGGMTGSFVGGFLAHWFGYRFPCVVAGFLQFFCVLLVFAGARERFVRPKIKGVFNRRRFRVRFAQVVLAFPALGLLALMSTTRTFDMSFLPLLVQDIHGGLEGASLWTGALGAVGGIAGFSVGMVLGKVADRMEPGRVVRFSAFWAGVLMLVHGTARGFAVLFPARFGMVFFSGALEPTINIWLAKITPERRRGFIFGWAASARSVGWMAAPLLSGLIATTLGLRFIYAVGAALFLLLIPIVAVVIRRLSPDARAG